MPSGRNVGRFILPRTEPLNLFQTETVRLSCTVQHNITSISKKSGLWNRITARPVCQARTPQRSKAKLAKAKKTGKGKWKGNNRSTVAPRHFGITTFGPQPKGVCVWYSRVSI